MRKEERVQGRRRGQKENFGEIRVLVVPWVIERLSVSLLFSDGAYHV
jgi:hypothetical protein